MNQRQQQRMAVWLMLFVLALVCGVPINHASLLLIGVLCAWVMSK
jgi:hypothetical protein